MKSIYVLVALALFQIMQIRGQSFNHEVNKEGTNPVLLGKINKEAFTEENYPWFVKNYQEYSTKLEVTTQLSELLQGYTITAFMGTWCGDSKKEVPAFYKVLEESEFPLDRLTMVAVSRDRDQYKQSPGGEHEGSNIHRVPTFIFYKNGKEVNRMVEHPKTNLEEDMLALLKGPYTANYHGVALVDELLTEVNHKKFNKKQRKLLKDLKREIKNKYELNTYANVLFFGNRKQEGVIAARINTLLFPNESSVHTSLANKLYQIGNVTEAIQGYEKALELDPENKTVKENLEKIKAG